MKNISGTDLILIVATIGAVILFALGKVIGAGALCLIVFFGVIGRYF